VRLDAPRLSPECSRRLSDHADWPIWHHSAALARHDDSGCRDRTCLTHLPVPRWRLVTFERDASGLLYWGGAVAHRLFLP